MFDASTANFVSFSGMLKATPAEEGGQRFVYLEASNEARDLQGEVVLAKALEDSADYFLRYGNLDLDHITQLGPKQGIKDYAAFEIGRPSDVRVDGKRTMVKGEIFSGDTPVAANAGMFWDSLTKCMPPQRWYPSVGGAVTERAQEMGPKGPQKVIRGVRWTNIGFSKTPVNTAVPHVATVPFGALMKSLRADGALDLTKALEAGYGTDSATLAGGAALREQSLDGRVQSYWDFRDRMADDMRKGRVGGSPEALTAHAHKHYGVDQADGAEWAERFLSDVATARSKQKVLH